MKNLLKIIEDEITKTKAEYRKELRCGWDDTYTHYLLGTLDGLYTARTKIKHIIWEGEQKGA